MAMEKRLKAVPPQLFTSNGTSAGQLTVSDASLFKVKQKVIITGSALPILELEVKRVLEDGFTVLVGPEKQNIDARIDLSLYTTAATSSIHANEQLRPSVPEQEIERLTYEEEPVVARRSILVDKLGKKIDSVTDSNGVNRIAVDGTFTAEVDVQVDVDIEGVYDPIDNPDPDNMGIIGNERSLITDETKQTQRITAKRGDVSTDTVSVDVSMHDSDGNAYSPLNPMSTTAGYEKFFGLINASKWMVLGNYDEIVPTFINNDTDMILGFKEDGVLIGEAVVTGFSSLLGWHVQLYRYINDDNGDRLQDDDGTFLNLD